MNIKSKKILFVGNSITDCGRNYPIGKNEGLGNGYVSLINSILSSKFPNKNFEILNTGISGNRITDLYNRWEKDVIALQPDCLCIKIGINDVWRNFDIMQSDDQVSPQLYKKLYEKLIEKTLITIKEIILISPYYIEPDKSDPMRKMMDNYRNIVRETATKYNLIYIDTQIVFDHYLLYKSYKTLTEDKVHPNQTGHMIIANAVLERCSLI